MLISLSVILFVLALNPLSHLLRSTKGYAYVKNRLHQHTHNFFVGDLKLYASDINTVKRQLEIVTTFSKDIGMKFGEEKCVFLQIEKEIIKISALLNINHLTIQPVADGDSYKYLGIDENITYNGPLNKEKVCKEYLNRVRKKWSSEMPDFNKVIAHNSFAVPVITPTIGIIDWTIDEIRQVDINTRKLFAMTGSFHPNSDVDRIYMSRAKGGRGLRSIRTLYESRIISLRQHLLRNANRNEILGYVRECEHAYIIRVGKELLVNNDITETPDAKPKSLSRKYAKAKAKEHEQQYIKKKMHGYYYRKLQQNDNIDISVSQQRSRTKQITSQFEGYLGAIHDQEIPTKFLVHKKQIDSGQSPTTNDALAKYILKAIITKNHRNERYRDLNEYEFVKKIGDEEYWWNISIKTATKIPHNKPDLVIWDKENKICSIVEFSCPADINTTQKVNDQINVYGLLIRNLQIMYPKYKFNTIPIIVGALGYIPKCLTSYLQDLRFDENEATVHIMKILNIVACCTLKICKTFLRFK